MIDRLLADENIPERLIGALRALGYDVRRVRDDNPGAPDEELYSAALADRRIILTLDKRFARYAFAARTRVPGIILVRLPRMRTQQMIEIVTAAFRAEIEWRGHISIIESRRVRSTALPRSGS